VFLIRDRIFFFSRGFLAGFDSWVRVSLCSINFLFCLFNRYPTLVDALRDLDDCLTMVHLFVALPAVDGERIEVKRIYNCRRFVLFDIAEFSQSHVIFECP